jgi:hypothetical protein
MDNLTIFVAVTSTAVVIQAGILVAMYLAFRETSARVEALATEVRTKVLPAAEIAQAMLVELRPKVENIITNVSDSTTLIQAQIERLDGTVNDTLDRARLQVIRADELLTRTLDKVERTTEVVERTVVSPVKHLSGLLQGLSTGFEVLFAARRRRRDGVGVSQDEMFI